MNFENIIKKKSKLLLPFSRVYEAGVTIHNKLYDWGWNKAESFGLPVICVGNLSVGGTGKTPMVEYLLRLLTPNHKVAIISRGYKRETSGILVADENTTAAEIGDEPMQFHKKFPEAKIVVGEKRVDAIKKLSSAFPETNVIILDDAFQHRAVKAGLNILLTEYDNLFTDDLYLPAGQLRDLKSNYKRADIIIVTKCPPDLSVPHKYYVVRKINPLMGQEVFFTTIGYDTPYHIFNNSLVDFKSLETILLVTGIANPKPLIDRLKRHDIGLKVMRFSDHHKFSQTEIESIKQTFHNISTENKIIITTEKDAMRLKAFEKSLEDLPVFAMPVRHLFLFDGENEFNNIILRFVNKT